MILESRWRQLHCIENTRLRTESWGVTCLGEVGGAAAGALRGTPRSRPEA